jgi:hypothetical protein
LGDWEHRSVPVGLNSLSGDRASQRQQHGKTGHRL